MVVLPTSAAADYLRAIGAAAVYVLADPWGLARTGVTQHLQRTFDAWEQQHFEPMWIGWVGSLSLAQWLADTPAKYRQKHGNISALTWQQVVELILGAAELSDPITSEPLYTISNHETTIKNAAQMAQQVRINMDELKQKGALRTFNAAYKKYNHANRSKREYVVNFGVFEAELFNSICEIVATGAEPLSQTVLAQMRAKFPWLSSVKD